MKKILVVEDNRELAYGLRSNLEFEGYRVEVAGDGETALAEIERVRPDLVILDLMLPGDNGLTVLRRMRSDGHQVPVLILTALGEEATKVQGLRLGADDYVTKPFGVLELLARIEALLRRASPPAPENKGRPERWQFGDVVVDPARRMVLRKGEEVSLTPKEFDLLLVLLRRQGAVASRLELIEEVWGYSGDVVTRTVDTHIAELRKKLETDPSRPRHILTVHKVGYRLVSESSG